MVDIEALYVVRFANRLVGAGIVVLETPRLFGGDSMYYYVGDYRASGDKISAQARIIMHTEITEAATIFGDNAKTFDVHLNGTLREDGTIIGAMVRTDGRIAAVSLEYQTALR